MRLTENTLYTNDTEKQALAADKERLMDSLMINFFGFLGMYSIGTRGSLMTQYPSQEGKLIIRNIGDVNRDVSLAVKMAYDAGLIKMTVVNKMTKLLALIKQKKLTYKNIDVAQIRKFLDEIHYMTHRPSMKVLTPIRAFHDEQITIWELARDLYKVSKLKEYKDISKEFRQTYLRGNYGIRIVDRLKAAGMATDRTSLTQPTAVSAAPAQTAAASTPVSAPAPSAQISTVTGAAVTAKAKMVKANSPASANKAITAAVKKPTAPDTSAATQQAPTTVGDTDEFYEAILKAGTKSEFMALFKTYGVEYQKVNVSRVREWLPKYMKNVDAYIPDRLGYCPFYQWVSVYGMGSRNFVNLYNSCIDTHLSECADKLPFSKIHDKLIRIEESIFYSNNNGDLQRTTMEKLFNLLLREMDRENTWKGVCEKLKEFVPLGKVAKKLNCDSPHQLCERIAKNKYDDKYSLQGAALVKYNFFTPSNLHKWLADILKDVKVKFNGGNYSYSIDKVDFDALSAENREVIGDIGSDLKLTVVDSSLSADVQWAIDWLTPSNYINLTAIDTDKINRFTDSDIESIANSVFLDMTGVRAACCRTDDAATLRFLIRLTLAYWKTHTAQFEDIVKLWKNIKSMDAQTQSALIDATYEEMKKHEFFRVRAAFDAVTYNVPYKFTSKIMHKYLKETSVSRMPIDIIFRLCEDYAVDMADLGILPNDTVEDVFDYFKHVSFGYRNYVSHSLNYARWFFKKEYKNIDEATKTSFYCLKYYSDDFLPTPEIAEKIKANESVRDKLMKSADFGFYKPHLCAGILKFLDELCLALIKDDGVDVVEKRCLVDNASTAAAAVKVLNALSVSEIEDMVASAAYYYRERLGTKLFASPSLFELKPEAVKAIFVDTFNSKNATSATDKELLRKFSFLIYDASKAKMKGAQKAFELLPANFQKRIIKNITDLAMMDKASQEINNDAAPIKPAEKVDKERMQTILKFNNVTLPSFTKIKTLADVEKVDASAMQLIEDLKVETVEASDEELDKKTIEYDKLTNGRHGNVSVKILREFNVDIPIQKTGFEEFKKYKPNSQIIDPAFHGTGSVAASMILRYGFAVIKSGDSSVVGRMLGNGIYFSTVLDKVAQYVSDGGYSRGKGNRGYIFQMKAILGDRGKDYRSAGLGNDNIRSPEWCVFDANRQLKIYKAFEVELVSKQEIQNLRQKYNINEENTMKLTAFKEFIREAEEKDKRVTSFIFVDGTIPVSVDNKVDFEEFVPAQFGKNVTMEPSAYGPQVYIEHDGPESECFCVPSTVEFMTQEPELFNKYLTLIGAKNDAR